jgi:hypothetical protein
MTREYMHNTQRLEAQIEQMRAENDALRDAGV